jgi:hypothetical protein
VFVVRLIVATRISGPPDSGKIIKEMPGSVASGTSYIIWLAIKIASDTESRHQNFTCVAVRSTGDQGRQHSHNGLQAEF